MEMSSYAIGQAVYIRTDSPEYIEETIPFKTLDELVKICSQSQPNLTLEKIVIYGMPDGEPCALTLGFVSSTKGQRPGHPELSSSEE